jgi:hypothetical protein
MIQDEMIPMTTAPSAVDSARPSHDPCVFIVGFDRSGTSLLHRLMCAHSQLHIIFEAAAILRIRHLYATHDLEALIRALLEDFASFRAIDFDGLRSDVRMLGAVDFADVVALLYRRVAALHGKPLWGEKDPAFCRHVLPLATMFPRSRFIQIVRDPRAVAMSLVRHISGPGTCWHAAREWAYSVGLAAVDLGTLGPHRGLTIRYEDLVRDPETTLGGICQFLDLDPEPGMIRPVNRRKLDLGSTSMSRLHQKSGEEIDARRATSWDGIRSRQLQHIEAVCQDLMRLYQYDPVLEDPASPTLWEEFGYKVMNRIMRYRKSMSSRIAGLRPLRYLHH